jgi:predicted metal-dependent hydrolase
VIEGARAGDRPAGSGGAPRPGTVLQGDRAKAYRPLPEADRRRAFEAAIAAYERGDFFEAHELLEPAWMGTDDLAERALHQGLIKLAAAYVHGVRRNPLGVEKNLKGARQHLMLAVGTAAEPWSGLDLTELIAAIDERLAREPIEPAKLSADPALLAADPPALRRRESR